MTPTPGHARLASELRELRARTGLSLAGLAAKTAYSKSSWERYLNGRTLPPRPAVRELCRLAGEPEGRCLALWEIAESEWSGRAAETTRKETVRAETERTEVPSPAPPSPPPTAAPAPAVREAARAGHRTVALVAVLASACAVTVGSVAVALLLLPGHDGESWSSALPSPSPSSAGPYCRGAACEGRDPMTMKCAAQPDTLALRRMATGAWMEVRYSRACGASWARTWGTRIGDRIEMSAGGAAGPVRRAEVRDGVDTDAFVYTPMAVTLPGTVVTTCFRPAGAGRWECFKSRVK
ncbi:helix-turn-helix domain-containing protein [Streptomyces sp. NPDC087903]|uniref:helix-turn-helix domain-containing protein n=1 Tax=Streptomyces sp. NPDC087903 TaxID=3365819 RepID=UPI0037F9EDC5